MKDEKPENEDWKLTSIFRYGCIEQRLVISVCIACVLNYCTFVSRLLKKAIRRRRC